MQAACSIITNATDAASMSAFVRGLLPDGAFRRIVIKPNWVRHEENPAFPIAALVTSSDLILAVAEACLEKYPQLESLTVADVPVQSCNWNALAEQVGFARIEETLRSRCGSVVRVLDLRRERYASHDGYLEKDASFRDGDPNGYREVVLDHESFLDPLSDEQGQFRVSDYDPEETVSSHRKGYHRYLISGSVLDADLFINLPKMKTHQKAGITGALKNLVGIVGQKAHLAHHRAGSGAAAGDEFGPEASALVKAQIRIRELAQKRSRFLFSAGQRGWKVLKRLARIETQGTPENLARRMYIGSGSWYGNDTIWRMVYDLNRIIRYAPRGGGALAKDVQRTYLAILDGVVAGEGNGPLQPIPVQAGILAAAGDPFLLDAVMAHVMGFAPDRIPLLRHARLFTDPVWARFDPETVPLQVNGAGLTGLSALPVLHRFVPPPGWKGHIEDTPSPP